MAAATASEVSIELEPVLPLVVIDAGLHDARRDRIE
jgi:hypothetical protein